MPFMLERDMMSVTRFAPSPTGYLHVGHAFSAFFANRLGERFLLRIEDIDPQRCKPEFTAAIFEDLAWLGLHWEEPVWHQSARYPVYQAALDHLRGAGLLYPCFCTRSDIQRAGGAPQGDYGPHYPGTCRSLDPSQRAARMAAGEPYALRLDAAAAGRRINSPLRWHDAVRGWHDVTPALIDDVVLARTLRGVSGRTEPLPASYHLCVTVDDAAQGVTLVTRGVDLLESTSVHRLLQHVLDLPTPAYHHHPLLTDATGKRLAKRDNAPSLRELRAIGQTPDDILKLFTDKLP